MGVMEGNFPWSESGLSLLKTIQDYIKANGGRTELMYNIVNEAPRWFDYDTKNRIRKTYNHLERTRERRIKNFKRNDFWLPDDVDFLLENYGKMKTRRLASILGRKPETIRMKFSSAATQEMKDNLSNNYKTWETNFIK